MKLKDIVRNDYFKLFVRREGKVVLGKRYSSLWLLCCVMTATFLAIAFSNASLDYLSYKMNDPFINWVDIKNTHEGDDIRGLSGALDREDIRAKYHINGYQTDLYWYTTYFLKNGNSRQLRSRYYANINTPLVNAILSEDNLAKKQRILPKEMQDESYGVIITEDALFNKLGYDEVPNFIYFKCEANEDAEFYGADIIESEGKWCKVPRPILAVVKRLPNNMDVISTKFFWSQYKNLCLNLDPDRNRFSYLSLYYFVPEEIDINEFEEDFMATALEHTSCSIGICPDDRPEFRGWKRGEFISLYYDYEDDVDFEINKQIHDQMMAKWGEKGVERVLRYDIRTNEYNPNNDIDYISVYMKDLNEIAAFQEYASQHFNIEVEMSQITAKENFNEVSIMANILSWTMIIFAIVCIILFIVNLLQSYFQKVKRNMGTFKAFGISNFELITIYVLILGAIILAAIIISLSVSWLIQEVLPLLGVYREGGFGYLSLWNMKTICSIVIITIASLSTVWIVMRNLLKATPGDLIYDR